MTLSNTKSQRELCLRLARHVGIPVLEEYPAPYSWDGTTMRWGPEMTPSNMLHEIAHWLVCPPEFRHLVDFGLGEGPETQFIRTNKQKAERDQYIRWTGKPPSKNTEERDRQQKVLIKGEFASNEEGRASMLGIKIEKIFGWDWQGTAEEHSWWEGPLGPEMDPRHPENQARRFAHLLAMGRYSRNRSFYDMKGVPLCLHGFN